MATSTSGKYVADCTAIPHKAAALQTGRKQKQTEVSSTTAQLLLRYTSAPHDGGVLSVAGKH